MPEPIEIVTNFCAAWSKLDLDDMMRYFSNDAVYHNIPVEPVQGRDDIRTTIATFTTGWDRVDFDIRNILADGRFVMTERIDRFCSSERVVELPVMGVFEVDDGLITAWRDYFDINQFMNQLTG
jgi:limonene-1,2-epoxide hydrolase